jgi:hypothetical protein
MVRAFPTPYSSAALAWVTKPRTIATAHAAIFFKTGVSRRDGAQVMGAYGRLSDHARGHGSGLARPAAPNC